MTTRFNRDEVTSTHIRVLYEEAVVAGDEKMAACCLRALCDDEKLRAAASDKSRGNAWRYQQALESGLTMSAAAELCIDAIESAAAMHDDEERAP